MKRKKWERGKRWSDRGKRGRGDRGRERDIQFFLFFFFKKVVVGERHDS